MKRLVESAAFAFARVKEKIEDDVPEISHAITAFALPELLQGMPSATVVRLVDPSCARRSVTRDAGALRFATRPIDGVPCIFESVWPVTLAPLSLSSSSIVSREAGVQTLTLRLELYPGVNLATGIPPSMRFFVETRDPLHALDLVAEVTQSTHPISIRAFDKQQRPTVARTVPELRCTWAALESPFRLYPGPGDRFQSGSALRAFYAFPEAFGFFHIDGLSRLLPTLDLPPDTRALELTIRLRQPVREDAMEANVLLDCVPVVNVFSDVAVLSDVRDVGPCGTLVPSHHPDAEIFYLRSLRLVPTHQNGNDVPVRLWEREDSSPLNDSDLFVKFERRAAIGRGPTSLSATLVRPAAIGGAPHGTLYGDVLISDGQRTDGLLQGDVALLGDPRSVNITSVTAPQPPIFDQRIPWRANAFARMPVPRFVRALSLNDYLSIHDLATLRNEADLAGDQVQRGVLASRASSVKRVEDGAVEHGDQVDLTLDERVFGGSGATWLVGELLAQAAAERADFLRYTRVRAFAPDGALREDYGVRRGERLPPPIG